MVKKKKKELAELRKKGWVISSHHVKKKKKKLTLRSHKKEQRSRWKHNRGCVRWPWESRGEKKRSEKITDIGEDNGQPTSQGWDFWRKEQREMKRYSKISFKKFSKFPWVVMWKGGPPFDSKLTEMNGHQDTARFLCLWVVSTTPPLVLWPLKKRKKIRPQPPIKEKNQAGFWLSVIVHFRKQHNNDHIKEVWLENFLPKRWL